MYHCSLKNGEPHEKKCEWLLRTKSGPWFTDSKETETSVLQLQGDKFC